MDSVPCCDVESVGDVNVSSTGQKSPSKQVPFTDQSHSTEHTSSIAQNTSSNNQTTSRKRHRTECIQQEEKLRSKRLLGVVMGTLAKATSAAENDSKTHPKRFEMEQRLREKIAQERVSLRDEMAQEELRKKSQLVHMRWETDERRWKSLYSTWRLPTQVSSTPGSTDPAQSPVHDDSQLIHGIFTKASPSVIYMPAKHNATTSKLLHQSLEQQRRQQQDRYRLYQQLYCQFTKEKQDALAKIELTAPSNAENANTTDNHANE